jgi:hypothetical protein
MRVIMWGALVVVAVVAALPFIVLSWTGMMKPLEGFCLEHGLADNGDPPGPEEAARSYFVSPELGYRYQAITEHISWPTCIRSQRGMHRTLAWGRDRDLASLREPKLSSLHRTDAAARAFRVLTHASFSPLPLAFRLEMDRAGGASLNAAWLGDSTTQVPTMGSAESPGPLPGLEAAVSALPRQTSVHRISDADARALWSLLHEATPRYDVFYPVLDGNWMVIEVIENGERTARLVQLGSRPDPAARLLCALAAKSDIPPRALVQGLTENPCAEPART